MRYIHSFLRKIKDIGNYIWNSVRTDGKVGNRTIAYLTAVAVLAAGAGLTGNLLENSKKRTEKMKTIETSVNVPVTSVRDETFFAGVSAGQLVSAYITESEEAALLEEDLDEILVLFGTVAGNMESFTSIANKNLESKVDNSAVSVEPQLLLGTIKTAAGEETVFSEYTKISLSSLSAQEQNAITKANQGIAEKTALSGNKTVAPKVSGKTSAEKTAVIDKSTANKAVTSNKTEAGSGSAVEKRAKETEDSGAVSAEAKTGTQIAETVKKTDLEGGLILTYNTEMVMTLTKEEMEIMERIVEAEATDEDIYGKVLVANVVLNRVLCSGFPNTVKEVVFQKGQFSPIRDGRYYSVKVTSSTKEAVKRALAGEDYSDGALFFFARKKTTAKKASWFDNSLQRLFRYGGHEFFKNK